MVFNSEISIWPSRYNAIRTPLEKLFGVDLPDFANELKQWSDDYKYGRTIHEVQASLQYLGYDIGPDGSNGKFTKGTSTAIIKFKKDQKLPPDSILDVITVKLLHEMIESISPIVAGRLIDLSNAVMNGEDNITAILDDITNRQKKSLGT
jgi:peptidoglycan hydrolase-like protein with peptidoglycan-binding domain